MQEAIESITRALKSINEFNSNSIAMHDSSSECIGHLQKASEKMLEAMDLLAVRVEAQDHEIEDLKKQIHTLTSQKMYWGPYGSN